MSSHGSARFSFTGVGFFFIAWLVICWEKIRQFFGFTDSDYEDDDGR